jgi:hypothetical protein
VAKGPEGELQTNEAKVRARAIGAIEEEPLKGLRRWLSPMPRNERQNLFERIEADAVGGRDYYVMLEAPNAPEDAPETSAD